MKKNILKLAALFIVAAMLMLPLTACESDGGSDYGDRKEIRIGYYTGEFGDIWLKELADAWNEANPDSPYYFSVKGHLLLSGSIVADIKSGSQYSMFFSEDCNFGTIFNDEYLEDLTDVLNSKPDGESGKTVSEKINNKDVWMQMSTRDGKCYMIPYNLSPTGLIFDYDRFLENGWLFDKDGKLGGTNGVSAGKDGIEGTYDDGQPQTMDQFKAMCEKIRNTGTEVFMFMGVKAPDYLNNVGYAYLAQYLGEENFEIFYTHDSKGKEVELIDGTKTAFTVEEGYKSYQMKGVDEMFKFFSEYLCNKNYVSEATLNDVALTVDASHTQFITAGGPAFIIEGNWFENGSRSLMENLIKYDPTAKEYGTYNYRYMMVPASTEGKSVMHSQTGGGIIMPKCDDEAKLSAMKDFLTFVLSNENMGKVTQDTGMIWNYNYEISEEHRQGMTVFTRNTYDMMQDTQNVIVRSGFIDTASVPVHAYSALGTYSYALLNASTQSGILPALMQGANGNPAAAVEDMISYNNAERWEGWLEVAKTFGYYAD